MVEKTVITALIGIFATVGYAEIAEQSEDILQEATVVAASLQEREIKNALEIYWLKHHAYPNSEDEEVVEELYKADLLDADEVVYEVEYRVTKAGQDYELKVS